MNPVAAPPAGPVSPTGSGPPASDTPPAPVLTLFGAGWCEDTRRTRRLLRRLGIRHRYRDVDEDLDALDRATVLNQGVRRTPVVTIGSDVFVEPTNSAMTSALLAHGLLTRDQVAERLHLQNVGDFERVIRVSSGLLVLASQRQAPAVLRGLFTLTGTALVLTGVFGWCPVFHAKGVSSLNGPGDRPEEAERQTWLRPGRRADFDQDPERAATQ
jgi:mycoredoxin